MQVVRLLAEGAYAQVLLVRSSATNETFALKRILCQSQEVENDVQMELQVFRVRPILLYCNMPIFIVLTNACIRVMNLVCQASQYYAAGRVF